MDIELRFSEMKNTSYADYAEQARVALLKSLDIPEDNLLLARIAFDFKKLTRYQDNVFVETTIEQLGRSSITMQHIVFSSDEVGAVGNTVVVHVNEQGEPQMLPSSIRQKLEPYLKD